MNFAIVLLAILQSAAPTPQTPSQNATATIEGFVLRAGTDEPISRARISVIKMTGPNAAPIPPGPRQAIPTVNTDSQGHFVLKTLDPGAYSITAQRNGFAQQPYGGRAPGRPGAPVNVVAGQTVKDLVFRLIPGGTITGRVADSTGEPIAGMTVQLDKSSYDLNGKRSFQTVSAVRTDDRGEYRIYWITPGRYYLNVTPRETGPINSNEVLEPGYVPTYYPGTTDASMAEAIEVQPGAELSAMDFTLRQQPIFHVRGRLFDVRTGQFPRNAIISLNARLSEGAFFFTGSRANYNSGNGTFEFRDVPPGPYWIRAIAVDPRTGLTASDIARNSAQVPINVTNADVENVPLALSSGFQLTGRVLLDGASLAVSDLERMTIFLRPLEDLPIGPSQQQLKADGLFALENIPAGEYRVMLLQMPPNTFIESIRLGQTDVAGSITLSGPVSDPLEVALSTKGGLIEGNVVDKEQKPITGAQAVLIPDRQRDRRDLYRPSISDQNGHFTMRSVAPGDYRLFAWEDLEPGAYNDPDFIRKYEPLGIPVKLSESATLNVEIKVLPTN